MPIRAPDKAAIPVFKPILVRGAVIAPPSRPSRGRNPCVQARFGQGTPNSLLGAKESCAGLFT